MAAPTSVTSLSPSSPTSITSVGAAVSGLDLRGKDLLTLASLSGVQIRLLMDLAANVKADVRSHSKAIEGKTAIMTFEKPSLRTKVTFEVGIQKLGGIAIYMDQSASKLGERESIKDYAKNLERWVDCIIARVFSQQALEELALHSRAPVINALSDRFHPCQALADVFTLRERLGTLAGARLAYVGDGNNVCHSLMHAATLLGVDMTVVTPPGRAPAADVAGECQRFAAVSGAKLAIGTDINLIAGHHAVYTDVWISMGASDKGGSEMFRPYQVNGELMAIAGRGMATPAYFMHCLPAHRGMEVTDEVIDSAASIVYDQAENRMHVQNALLMAVIGIA